MCWGAGGCCLLVNGGGSEIKRVERGEHKSEAAGLPEDMGGEWGVL